MTTSVAADQGSAAVGQGAAWWLALAASPILALMALIAPDGRMALCAAAPHILPFGSMTAMYLLMSLFHLSPWLKLAGRRVAQPRAQP